MIVEHEIIEQIEEEPNGRSLAWVCDLARRLGKDDPLRVLEAMVEAGLISLTDERGRPLEPWECSEIWRSHEESRAVHVIATSDGSRSTHG